MDREEAWVLETVGKYWAAEKITGEWGWLVGSFKARRAKAMVPGLKTLSVLLPQALTCSSFLGTQMHTHLHVHGIV